MKFGHTYSQHLLQDGFPAHWVESAISYRQLKKCIKKVEQELQGIGLDAASLDLLLKSVEAGRPRYDFKNGDEQGTKPFLPKLVFAVDEATGEPIDAGISSETKDYIHQLALSVDMTNIRITNDDTEDPPPLTDRPPSQTVRLLEIPLSSDSEFFTILHDELSRLAALQAEEKQKLSNNITELGQLIARLTDPSDKKAKHDLAEWRRVFEQYLDSRVFFATNEQDHGIHNFDLAQKNFMSFLEMAHQADFKKKESLTALQKFVEINTELLQNMRFQELNQTAITKIIKKFDKRTGLGVKTSLPQVYEADSVSIAKSVSSEVSKQILAVVPQLGDYLCPICFSIAYRPIRLKCGHLFCIRCLIVMQREQKVSTTLRPPDVEINPCEHANSCGISTGNCKAC